MSKPNMKLAILKLAFALLAIGGLNNAWAAGCTQDSPGAKVVALVDGTSGCAALSNGGAINTWTGCRMSPGTGGAWVDCTVPGKFKALSRINPADGSVQWQLDPSYPQYTTAADAVVVGGGNAGSNCGYFYKDDAVAGSKLGYFKSNNTYQNVTYVDVCTNQTTELTPPVTRALPTCPADVQAALDDGSIKGDYAVVGEITDGDSATLCLKSGVTIQECINEERKGQGPDPSGLPLCSKGPTGDGITDLNFKRDLNFSITKTGDNSAIFVCLPPTYTFSGGSSCGWVYY